MAKVLLQAAPSSKLFGDSKLEYVLWRLEGDIRKRNSVSVSPSGVGIRGRGVARSFWVSEDLILIGLSKDQSRAKKNPSRIRARPPRWSGGRSWSSGRIVSGIVSSGNGDFNNGESANDGRFIDQVYDYGSRDGYYPGAAPPEGVRGVNGEVGSAGERLDVQGDVEERRFGARRRDDGYNAEELGSPIARKEEEENDSVGRPTDVLFREDDERSLRSPYIRSARDNSSERTFRASANAQERPGDRQEGTESFPFEEELLGSELNTSTNGDLWQGSNRTRGQTYPSNRDRARDRENSDLGLRNARDYDDLYDRRESPPNELGAVDEYRSPPADGFDNRYDFRNSGKYEASDIADDEEQEQFLPKGGSSNRDRNSSRVDWRDPQQDLSTRGALYAKQVISLATAQSLGFVTQVWVDLEILKVVALEVRPSLLFGNFNSFPLKSLSKVGDVILIHDNDVVLEERDLFSCSDLVGNDLFSEDGIKIGKVRDYDFSLEDGAVLSLEFDKFGLPLIPSTLIKTYSLQVDEVIETQEGSLLLQKGAEKRAQKLSKGLFSRSKQSSKERQSPWRQQRKQVPEIQSLGQASERAAEIMDKYTKGYNTPRQQPKRGSIYSDGRRGFVNESLPDDQFESDQSQALYPRSASSRSKDLTSEESEGYQAVPLIREDSPGRDSPQTSEYEQAQGPDSFMSMPEMIRNSRGSPMSYRNSKKRVENDY